MASLMPSKRNRQLFSTVLCFILLFVFFSFRDIMVINDTSHYYAHAYHYLTSPIVKKLPFYAPVPDERFEYLFTVFERILLAIWPNPYSITFFTSTLITIVLLWYINKYLPGHVAMTCFFLFPLMVGEHNIIRQTYAILLFYFAFERLKRGHLKIYYLLVLLAIGFHISAIILLFVPIFRRIKFNRRNVTIALAMTAAIALFIYELMGLLGLGTSSYIVANLDRSTTPLAAIINAVQYLLLFAIATYIYQKYKVKDCGDLMKWMALLTVSTTVIGIPLLVFSRFSQYFIIYLIFYFLTSVYYPGFRKSQVILFTRRFIYGIVVAVYIVRFYIINEYKNEWSNLYPYSFHDFQGGKRPEYHWTPDT